MGTTRRFDEMVELTVDVLRDLGVDARAGEVPGEYCPGSHSVNAGGRTKIMGVGQRVIRGGAHVGGVVVVDDAERVRDVLVPVYEALELEWRPATVGSVADEIGFVTFEDVRQAFESAFARRGEFVRGSIDHGLLLEAEALRGLHDPAASRGGLRSSAEAAGPAWSDDPKTIDV